MLTRSCPNCESAYTGGHPNPNARSFCVVCSDPCNGKIRGWVWRFNWFHSKFVVRKNVNFITRLSYGLDALYGNMKGTH